MLLRLASQLNGNLAVAFAAIGWIVPSFLTAQWRRAILATGRLPFPVNLVLLVIETNHFRQDRFNDALRSPYLKPLMGCATRNAELCSRTTPSIDSWPTTSTGLRSTPVDSRAAVGLSTLPRRLRQRLDSLPKRFRYFQVIDLLAAQTTQFLVRLPCVLCNVLATMYLLVMGLLAQTIFYEIHRSVEFHFRISG